jgi:hypothetical protein
VEAVRKSHRFTSAVLIAALAGPMWAVAPAFAGPYSRIQVLVPGETAAPGTSSGKTGTPRAQTEGVPFSVTVRACDSNWNLVTSVTNLIQISSTDNSATLPPDAALSGGTRTFSVTFNAAPGPFTVFAHDQNDNTVPDGASAAVSSIVLQSFAFSSITQKNQYAGQPLTITITARDPGGVLVSGYDGPARLKEITSLGEGRIAPDSINFSSGTWTGAVTCYRADETSINRGNVNLLAYLSSAPQTNGSSDPFTVHPGPLARLQITVPGETALPGSVSGKTGTPATQSAGRAFNASVQATDNWWNPLPSGDNTRVTSSDPAANTPLTAVLVNGFRQFSVILGTVGTQTLTVADLTNGSIQGMTSAGINVAPSSLDHFVVGTIASPQTAGVAFSATIRAVDSNGNTVPNFNGDGLLQANTGTGSMTPENITFASGVWNGSLTFRGAGGAVAFTCSDFSAPPRTGTSNSFRVDPGPLTKLLVLLPGESARGGTASGKTGTPNGQQAGTAFTVTVLGTDAFWNVAPGVTDSVMLGSSDGFGVFPAHIGLANGQALVSATLYSTGPQTFTASDITQPSVQAGTSAATTVTGGPFAKLLILAPGEFPAPGTANGRGGTATDESINYAFNVTVLATDNWWNPVGGVTDVVHVTSDDPLATLPPDQALVDGRAEMPVTLARGGYDLISVADASRPSIPGASTQVRAISSGFHLEATVSPTTAQAGAPFTLHVQVVNDAGSVIREINSFVTVDARNSSSGSPGAGTLLTRTFQLLQGERSISETYTFAEPIVIVAHDDAGNQPATSNTVTITPGPPATINLTSNPPWVGGNQRATLTARVTDFYGNGEPDQPMSFTLVSGTGALTPIDAVTAADGSARCDFQSPRNPETDRIRAATGALSVDLDLQVSYTDPNAPGGYVTNFPNPFHPPLQSTTILYKLDDLATVTLRIFSLSGQPVLERTFARGTAGGSAGENSFDWDGRNGRGDVVASGGYIVLIEAQGQGSTLNVIRRKIGVVR